MAALPITLPTWTPVPGRSVHFIVCDRCHRFDPDLLTTAEAERLNGAMLYGTFSLTDGRGGIQQQCGRGGGGNHGPCGGQLTVQRAVGQVPLFAVYTPFSYAVIHRTMPPAYGPALCGFPASLGWFAAVNSIEATGSRRSRLCTRCNRKAERIEAALA